MESNDLKQLLEEADKSNLLSQMPGNAGETLWCLLELAEPEMQRICLESPWIRSWSIPIQTRFSQEHREARRILLEAQYRGLNMFAEQAGCLTVVDFPCGYVPRPLQHAESYIGLGMEEIVQVAASVSKYVFPDSRRATYCAADPTNPSSLFGAIHRKDGPICVLSSGLLMYLTDTELEVLFHTMAQILRTYGGFWMTPDPESACFFMGFLKAVCGESYMDVLLRTNDMRQWRLDGQFENTLIIDPRWDFERLRDAAMAALRRYGLTAERIPADRLCPELRSVPDRPGCRERAAQVLHQFAYWKITADTDIPEKQIQIQTADLKITAEMNGSTLDMTVAGRIDSLSAPEFLEIVMNRIESESAHALDIHCELLEYFSSSGLRALLQLCWKCEVTLINIRSEVLEILKQTGFDSLVRIHGVLPEIHKEGSTNGDA